MKTRTCALISLLTLWAPAAVGVVGGAIGLLAPRQALAQDNITKLAREKFMAGVEAYDKGHYEEARALFLQVYALKRHPAVLLNLGQSELKAGYIEAGGNHLQQFLRLHKTATAEQQQAAKAGIAAAQKRTGFAIIIVDADGALVGVDGQPAGTAPLLDPWFVKPGKHQASAALRGKTAKSDFVARRGAATPVTINLGVPGVTPTPTPAPTPTAAPTGTAPRTGPTGTPPGYPPPTGAPSSTAVGPMPGPPMGPPPDTGTSGGRENFFHWYTHRPIAWVLTGLTGAGLIGTIAFGAAAGSAAGAADDVTSQIETEVQKNSDPNHAGYNAAGNLPNSYYSGNQPQPCGSEEQGGAGSKPPHPFYAGACQQLRDNLDARDADVIGMGIFIGVGAAAAIGTVVYYFIDSPTSSRSASLGTPLIVAPLLTPTEQGLGIAGSF